LPTVERSLSSQRPPFTFSWGMLIGANILWASSYVAAKFALNGTSLVIMLALRMCISSLVLLPLLWIKRGALRLTRRDLPQLALLSLVGFVLNKLFEFGGLALTTASDVALLISSETLFTALFSWLLLRERFKKTTLCALLLGLVGVYLIVERGVFPNLPSGGGVLRVVGDLLVVMGLLVEAFYTVRGKALLVKHSPLLITAASIVGSVVFWIPVAGVSIVSTGWQAPTLAAWFSIGWLAIMATSLAYLAWFQGLSQVHGSIAAATLFIQPLLGTLLAIVLLKEQLTFMTVLGGLLILVSVSMISLR
jgi:drug/metabolite transporter (DMT)-like permease